MNALEKQGRNVLALPDFRRLWLIGLLLSVARWLEMLVVGVVVFQHTGSAFLVATMTLLRLLPLGLFGALLGVLADRLPRRSALLGVLALQGCTIGALALLAFAGTLAVWQLALASFLSGLGWATDNPVRRMLVGESVGPARMGSAMSLDVMANNASRVAGPALGGTLLAMLGLGMAFGLGVVLYLVAFAAALGVTIGRHAAPPRRERVLSELRGSFALALSRKRLRAVLLVTVIYNMFGWPCSSMVPVIGQASLGLGPEGIGVLASMEGVGALLGALLVGFIARPQRQAKIYLSGAVVYLLAAICFALAPHPVLAGSALLLGGVGGALFATMQATLVYLAAPPEVRARAFGLLSTAIGSGLLGFLQLGIMAELIGAPAATALVALEGLVALAATRRLWMELLRDGPGTDVSHL